MSAQKTAKHQNLKLYLQLMRHLSYYYEASLKVKNKSYNRMQMLVLLLLEVKTKKKAQKLEVQQRKRFNCTTRKLLFVLFY